MPLKFRIYHIICYLVILLAAILFVDLLYELTRDHVTLDAPLWGILLIILFFGCYFGLAIVGIGFINALSNSQQIGRSKIILFWIFFFVQLFFQALILYNSVESIQRMIRLVESDFRSYNFFYQNVIFEFIGTIMCFLSIYLEIFSFLLIKAVRKNYRTLLEPLNNLDSNEFI